MYGLYNKKNLNLIILKILWEHTDADHRLMQQEIVQLVRLEYGLEIDRRSVRNNVEALRELFDGTDIEISAEHGYCMMSRDFTDAELRLLIDSVLFSHMISQKQAKDLIRKLKNLSSRYFKARVNHITCIPDMIYADKQQQLLFNLDIIDDAISENRKITFNYLTYGTDFKLHPKRPDYTYKVSPYQMITSNGHYYLVCNFEKYENLTHLRIDKMAGVEITEEKRATEKQVPELKNGFNLPKHMAEHIYMFSGASKDVILKTPSYLMDDLIDWFGKNFRILSETDGEIRVRVHSNEQAMFYWALQYGMQAEVLEPAELRERIGEALKEMCKKYRVEKSPLL